MGGQGELTASQQLALSCSGEGTSRELCSVHNCALFLLNRIALLQTPVCLEPGTEYSVDVYFSQPSASGPKAKSFILIDSVSNAVIIPSGLELYHFEMCVFVFNINSSKYV